MKTNRAISLLTVKNFTDDGESDFVFKGTASTPAPDRHGDIVEPLGIEFKNPLPLLWQHRQTEPVGTVVFDKPTKSGVTFTATIPRIKEAGKLKDRVDEARQSVISGLVRAVSIGFQPLEYSFLDDKSGLRFHKSEVFELSLVTIPANEEATISVAKSYDAATLARLGAKEVPAIKTAKTAPAKKETNLTYAEHIAALKNKIEAAKQRIKALGDAAMKAGSTFDGAQQEEFDAGTAEIEAIGAQIKRFETLMAMDSASAVPVVAGTKAAAVASRTLPAVAAPAPLEKGIGFAQWAITLGHAKGNLMQAEQIAKSRFADNAELNIAMKAAVAAGTTTDPTWAAPLVDTYQRFAGDFVEFLRPQTILGKFGTGNVPSLRRVPFNISIPAQISGGDGYWVGQGKAKPLTKFDFGGVKLDFAKVANIAVLTEELLRLSNPSAEVLVRDALAEALRARLDIDFVIPTKAAVAGVSPASITNGVTGVASAGKDSAAVRTDLQAVFGKFIAANNAPTSGVFIMSAIRALALSLMQNPLGQPEFPGITMTGGVLFGLPVIVSQYCPSDIVILVHASDILLADDGQVVGDASREPSLAMADAATVTGDSTVPTPAELVSMFQTNSVALRAERWITWKRRRESAVAVLTGVAWGDPTP